MTSTSTIRDAHESDNKSVQVTVAAQESLNNLKKADNAAIMKNHQEAIRFIKREAAKKKESFVTLFADVLLKIVKQSNDDVVNEIVLAYTERTAAIALYPKSHHGKHVLFINLTAGKVVFDKEDISATLNVTTFVSAGATALRAELDDLTTGGTKRPHRVMAARKELFLAESLEMIEDMIVSILSGSDFMVEGNVKKISDKDGRGNNFTISTVVEKKAAEVLTAEAEASEEPMDTNTRGFFDQLADHISETYNPVMKELTEDPVPAEPMNVNTPSWLDTITSKFSK